MNEWTATIAMMFTFAELISLAAASLNHSSN